MGMMSDMEHEDYGPKRRAAEKAIGQTRNFLAEQAQDPTNYLPAVGKLGKLAFGAAMALKGTDADATMFGGKLLPAKYIAQIEEALRNGSETAASIFKKTGYFKNPEGQWRKYITDKDASVNSAGYLKNYSDRMPTKNVLVHPDLYRIDQKLGDVPVSRETMSKDNLGAYYPNTKRVEVNSSLGPKEYFSTLLHELQHHIQTLGEATKGGSPSQFVGSWQTPKIKQAIESADKLEELFGTVHGVSYQEVSDMLMKDWKAFGALPKETKDDWKKVNQLRIKASGIKLSAPNRIPYQKYRNIPGEVEARVTQRGADRNFMAEENGLTNLYDLYGKEITNPDFYPNFQFTL